MTEKTEQHPIPDSVVVGGLALARWMALHGYVYWQLDAVADRNIVKAYGSILRACGFTHFIHHKATPVDGMFVVYDPDNNEITRQSASAGQDSYIAFRLNDDNDPVFFEFESADPEVQSRGRVGPCIALKIE